MSRSHKFIFGILMLLVSVLAVVNVSALSTSTLGHVTVSGVLTVSANATNLKNLTVTDRMCLNSYCISNFSNITGLPYYGDNRTTFLTGQVIAVNYTTVNTTIVAYVAPVAANTSSLLSGFNNLTSSVLDLNKSKVNVSNPIVTGNIGRGTASPGETIDIRTSDTDIDLKTYSDTESSSQHQDRYCGSVASPTVCTASGNQSEIGKVEFRPYNGVNVTPGAAIRGMMEATPNTSSTPGYIKISTTPVGSQEDLERLRITSAGLVGINTPVPNQFLTVNGSVNISGSSGKLYTPEICVGSVCYTNLAAVDTNDTTAVNILIARANTLNSTIISNNQSLNTEITARAAADANINGTKLNSSSPVFTGTMTGVTIDISGSSTSNSITTEAGTSSSGNSHITFANMTNGVGRFKMGLRDDEIGGSNNGSDFMIWRYNDSGSWMSNALTIARDTGLVSFGAVSVPWNNLTGFPSAAPQADYYPTALAASGITYTYVITNGVNQSIIARTGVNNVSNVVMIPHPTNISGAGSSTVPTFIVSQDVAGAIATRVQRSATLYMDEYYAHGSPSYSERSVNGANEVWRIYFASGSGKTAGDIAFQNDVDVVGNTNLTGTLYANGHIYAYANQTIGSGSTNAGEVGYNSTSNQFEVRGLGIGIRLVGKVNVTTDICLEGGNCLSNVSTSSGTGDVDANLTINRTKNYLGTRRNGQTGFAFDSATGSNVEELNLTPKLTFDINNNHTILAYVDIGANATNTVYGIVGENNKWNIWLNGNAIEHSYRNSTSGTRGNSNATITGQQCLVGTLNSQTALLYRNGVLLDSDSISALGSLQTVSTMTKIAGNTIGSGTFNASNRDLEIYKVVIWNETLSAAQVAIECAADPNQPTNYSNSLILEYLLNKTETAYSDASYVYDVGYISTKEYNHELYDGAGVPIKDAGGWSENPSTTATNLNVQTTGNYSIGNMGGGLFWNSTCVWMRFNSTYAPVTTGPGC